MKKDNGSKSSSFMELVYKLNVTYFKGSYKEPNRINIPEIMNNVSFFTSFLRDEENELLVEEVPKEELKVTLASFEMDKTLGTYGWIVESFIGFYALMEDHLLRVVQNLRRTGKVIREFNSNFISLIPKKDSLKTFDYFRPISLCN